MTSDRGWQRGRSVGSLVHPRHRSAAHPTGLERKRKKRGLEKWLLWAPGGLGGKKKMGLTASYDPPPAIPTQKSTQELAVFFDRKLTVLR